MTIKVGSIEIHVGEPYPISINLSIRGSAGYTQQVQIDHNDLADLHYAVKKALAEAKTKLGDRSGEIVT